MCPKHYGALKWQAAISTWWNQNSLFLLKSKIVANQDIIVPNIMESTVYKSEISVFLLKNKKNYSKNML